jgi:hypothetical protein
VAKTSEIPAKSAKVANIATEIHSQVAMLPKSVATFGDLGELETDRTSLAYSGCIPVGIRA